MSKGKERESAFGLGWREGESEEGESSKVEKEGTRNSRV